jgi:integrase
MTRNPTGSISISSVGGRLRLQFPRGWYDGKQKYHALNLPDTEDNRLYATLTIRGMEWDYLNNKFDRSLSKYFQTSPQTQDLTIADLWGEYCRYKSRSLKAASIHYNASALGRHITGCPYQNISQSLEIREWLLNHTTSAMTKRVVAALATAIGWGVKHQKLSIAVNPFVGMSQDIRVDRELPPPNAFTPEELERTIAAFRCSRYYHHYLPLVRFWFLTGCRPSEGIGLEWSQIDDEISSIRFDRSIIHLNGRVVRNSRSKTNRVRTFPINRDLRQLLEEQIAQRRSSTSLVFPAASNKPIDYTNFSHRAWVKTVEPALGRHSTPYSCRDTFITDQIGKGIPIAVIAKWCDNSVRMIETRYLDPTALDRFKPL